MSTSVIDLSEEDCYSDSETGSQFSDDSQNDPNFEIEETLLSLSDLSLKTKSKRSKINDVKRLDYEDGYELDEKDQKSYEIIQKMIEGGEVNKLKVDECKIYLRKHGLRLSGKKDILVQRIKEHVDIVNGGGEAKYPASSFVLNCKGNACKGDVVIFEQNVYEEFSIVSRSAKGGSCGTRIVAGRILKESYGAAKQQHTFTIEVLWSKGEKPLPPLHPLLIKGRNLYRLKTMRQKWEDEGERQRILLEKHSRGGAARSNREVRIQQKEMRKMQSSTRAIRNQLPNRKQENALAALPLHQRPPFMATTHGNYQRAPQPGLHPSTSFHEECLQIYPTSRSPIFSSIPGHPQFPVHQHALNENMEYPQQRHDYHMQIRNAVGNRPIHQKGIHDQKKQICRHFGQGRCHFGDRCKFSHELASNK